MMRLRRSDSRSAKRAAFGHRLKSVAREIPEDLFELRGVCIRHHRFVGEVFFKRVSVANFRAVAEECEGLMQQLAHVNAFERARALFRVDQIIRDDAIEAV